MGTNSDPHPDSVQKMRDHGTLSPKRDAFIKSHPSELPLGNCVEEGVNDCKSLRVWIASRKQCLPETAGPVHIGTHRDCGNVHGADTSPSQMGASAERGSGQEPPSLTRGYLQDFQVSTTLKGKIKFLPTESSGFTNHT